MNKRRGTGTRRHEVEPREAALTQVEHDTAGPQKAKASSEADTRAQAQRFEDTARGLGTDQDEDRFKDVLRTLAKASPVQSERSRKEKGQSKDLD